MDEPSSGFVPTADAVAAGRRPGFLTLDTLDDRREISVLLGHLPPAQRWRFVRVCCERCPGAGGTRPVLVLHARDRDRVRRAELFDRDADHGITAATYGFILHLSAAWGLCLTRTLGTLTEVVRGRTSMRELERQCGLLSSSARIS